MDRRGRYEDHPEEQPPYSRLFIVCTKDHKEEDFRKAFSEFGTIEDIRFPRDHNTGDPKGVAYIKFSKTSEAAAALEALHMKTIGNRSRPIKVIVAANRSEVSNDDDEKYRRLFITISRNATEQDIEEDFSKYGYIEYINIQKNRQSGESKGFAYVKYRKFSSAAKAYEEVNRKYRPVFAAPKSSNKPPETAFESNIQNLGVASKMIGSMLKAQPEGYTRLRFMCSPHLTKFHLMRLFDIIPGLEGCQCFPDYQKNCVKGTISYSNPVQAAYALEKLNHFEYPPGAPINLMPDMATRSSNNVQTYEIAPVISNLRNAMTTNGAPDLAQLAEAISEASALIKAVTGAPTNNDMTTDDLNYCSVKLPQPQPLADIDSPVAKRCFIVCKPQPPPLTVLRDIFCRFGNLINVYTLPNKTVGYARYAVAESADKAMATLHGAEICGIRIKVLEADEQTRPDINPNSKHSDFNMEEHGRKRAKHE